MGRKFELRSIPRNSRHASISLAGSERNAVTIILSTHCNVSLRFIRMQEVPADAKPRSSGLTAAKLVLITHLHVSINEI